MSFEKPVTTEHEHNTQHITQCTRYDEENLQKGRQTDKENILGGNQECFIKIYVVRKIRISSSHNQISRKHLSKKKWSGNELV